MNKIFEKDRIILGAYILQPYARSEQHIKELAECGIELIVCFGTPDEKTLDLLEKYHVGCIVTGIFPHWWGGDGERAGKLAELNPIENYYEGKKNFKDHPAIWGVDIGDEPSALDFEYYGKVADTVDRLFVNQFPYLNLYPNYASVATNSEDQTLSQLGTATYEEHIDEYIKKIALPYISYDFYIYSLPESIGEGKMYDNYRIVADACRKTGRDFWYIPQVNSLDPNVFTSENKLRYQAYTALCYGATVINWACYTGGWWSNNVLDTNGNKTEQYDKLKNINAEIMKLSGVYMKYRNVDTHLIGFENEAWLHDFPQIKSVKSLDTGVVRDLKADSGRLAVGQMIHKTDPNKSAYVICNVSDAYDKSPSKAKISFSVRERTVKVYSGEGTVSLNKKDDTYEFDLETCRGAIITIE